MRLTRKQRQEVGIDPSQSQHYLVIKILGRANVYPDRALSLLQLPNMSTPFSALPDDVMLKLCPLDISPAARAYQRAPLFPGCLVKKNDEDVAGLWVQEGKCACS